VSDDTYAVTVGGQVCGKLFVQPMRMEVCCSTDYNNIIIALKFCTESSIIIYLTMQINCEPPSEPPNGITEATVVVSFIIIMHTYCYSTLRSMTLA
jgi:hypothetical protein